MTRTGERTRGPATCNAHVLVPQGGFCGRGPDILSVQYVIQLICGPATRSGFGCVEERNEAVDTVVNDCQLGTTVTKLASRVVLC